MMARIVAALLAFLLPPLVLYIVGLTSRAWGVAALWLISQLLFWLVFAGPGFLLGLLSSLAAAWLVLADPPSPPVKHPIS